MKSIWRISCRGANLYIWKEFAFQPWALQCLSRPPCSNQSSQDPRGGEAEQFWAIKSSWTQSVHPVEFIARYMLHSSLHRKYAGTSWSKTITKTTTRWIQPDLLTRKWHKVYPLDGFHWPNLQLRNSLTGGWNPRRWPHIAAPKI